MRRRSNLKYIQIYTSYNSNINFFNDKIEFTIGIITGQSKTLMENPEENLKLVINKFLKQEKLSENESNIKAVLFNGIVLNLDKTL